MPREERVLATNGIHLHAVLDGPEDGQPVLMLHGFPEFWRCWHHQMAALAAAGYRVIVPDQRGYNRSDKPAGVAQYRIEKLVADVAGLLDTLGYDQVDLVAHDWGATVAAHFAEVYPSRIKHLVLSNGAHLNFFGRAFLRNPLQIAKSWYIVFNQLPVLPEFVMRRVLERITLGNSNPGSFSEDELRLYRATWAQPGALTGMINWYRAAFRANIRELIRALLRLRNPYKLLPPPTIIVPTLILWGEKDAFLTKQLALQMAQSCTNGRIEFFADATHWLPADKPHEVSARLLDFLKT